MTLILDNITIPERGTLEIKVDRTVEINVTAEQARKKVDHWLMDQVSSMIGAKKPSLVISGDKAVWRVPAWINFTQGHWEGMIGIVEVDVLTGEMLDLEKQRMAMVEYLETEVKPKLTPYQPQTREASSEYVANDVPRGKKFVIAEDGQIQSAE